MYCLTNFKTKKALKEAVKNGEKVEVCSGLYAPAPKNGEVSVEGPHHPKPHSWYARVTLKDGIIVRVK